MWEIKNKERKDNKKIRLLSPKVELKFNEKLDLIRNDHWKNLKNLSLYWYEKALVA